VLPHGLADEIADELMLARRALAYDETRVETLEALLDAVCSLARRLRREVTVDDLLIEAATPLERARWRQLLLALRTRGRC